QSRPRLFGVEISQRILAVHVVFDAGKLSLILLDSRHGALDGGYGFFAVLSPLIGYLWRGFADMLLPFRLLLGILNNHLALRRFRLIKQRKQAVALGVDELIHQHPKGQRLAVAVGDAIATQQLGLDFAGFFVSRQNLLAGGGVAAKLLGYFLTPVGDF